MRNYATRWLAAGLAAVLVVTLADSSALARPSAEAPVGVPHARQKDRAVPVAAVRPKAPAPAAQSAPRAAAAVTWPAAGSAEVRLGETPARAGALPVRVARGKTAAPAAVRVDLAAEKDGLRVTLRRTDGVRAAGPVTLAVDYGGFKDAYGGDWASRLQLVRLADRKVMSSRNDHRAGTLTAQVDASAGSTGYAVTAAPSGAAGNYGATPLALSSTWQVSSHTGEFNWSYPLRAPETPGNLSPQFSLTYSSGSLDGRTAATNNQPSWLGDGFDMWSGYIERSYKGCADDLGGNNGQRKTGDLCWFNDNVTLSMAGHSGPLVRVNDTQWRLKQDDGSRVEWTGGHWKVTTREGVQYFFGLNRLPGWTEGKPETQSVWKVPVFGNHAGEPCNAASYAASWCYQPYKWNLDHVVDLRGNTISYWYAKEGNSYGLDLGRQTVSYDRGGVLVRADSGTRHGNELSGTAPARMVFEAAPRCVPGANCALENAQSYPDVPFDQKCTANCTDKASPTFWTTQRLAGVTTYAGADAVERWSFTHTFPDPGDASGAGLWLNRIDHSGLYGGTVPLPPVILHGTAYENRVNAAGDGLPPMAKYRVTGIDNEYGGLVGVNYAPTNCTATALPSPQSNESRCFPVYWQPDGGQPLTDWMHKYVVASVTQTDEVGDSPTETTSYEYLDGGAWRYTDSELVNPERRTWSEWRGYGRVVERHGDGSGVRSVTGYRYFRGMNGDRLAPSGGVRAVSVPDSRGDSVPDDNPLSGRLRERIVYDGDAVVSSTINDMWQRLTVTQGSLQAHQVDTAAVREYIALSGGGWRRTQVNRGYDDDGQVKTVDDLGDLAVSGDEECSRTWYTGSRPERVEHLGVSCGATPVYPRDTISDLRHTYDAAGNPVQVAQVDKYVDGEPHYVPISRATFDSYGRPLESYDALDRKTVTGYTETGGLTTAMTVTNELGHTTTTELSPAWGEPLATTDPNGRRTDVRYDSLGRVIGVWLPGRREDVGEGPNLRYAYHIRNDAASAVVTDTLRANGNYVASYAIYDGFLRPRQTQAPGWGEGGVLEGRVLTDTIYDSRGLVVKSNANYYAEGAPGTTLVAAGDNNLPSQTITEYDGAGRPTATILRSFGAEKWRGSLAYHGDHTDQTPPRGGTATTEYVDADGKTTALHQYHGPEPEGDADVTRYTYTNTGQLATVTDPAGRQWRYEYDLFGRRVTTHDPDTGTASSTFDVAGQLLTATDARGKTLAYAYDKLGRKVEERADSATGKVQAKWAYDTIGKGLLTSSTRVDDGHEYTVATVGYDAAGRPTGSKVTIPAFEDGLAGSYQTNLTYRPDGSVASTELPRAGDLAKETLTLGYDDLGLPKKTAGDKATYVDEAFYTRFGELAQLSLGGAGAHVWNTYYYDYATRRPTRSLVEREATSGVQVNDLRYTYDPAGNLTQLDDVPEGGPADRQCFGYDHLRRMTEAWTTAAECSPGTMGGSSPYWNSYRYDSSGNRTSETQHKTGTTRTYEYEPDSHALKSVTTTGPNGPQTDTYEYDAAGNTVSRKLAGATQTLAWDAGGRLAGAKSADGKDTSIVYDADGTRLLRRDPTAVTLYLGGQEIRLARGTGALTGTRFYAHGGGQVAVRTAAGLHWQVADHHGTTLTTIVSDTLAVTRRQFLPFGESRGAAPISWPDEHDFVGGTRDASLGLVQLGARSYDPALGRFISVDPIIDSDDPQQLNGYAYANNNPASMSDPDGLLFSFLTTALGDAVSVLKAWSKGGWRAGAKKLADIKRRNDLARKRKQQHDAAVKASGHSRQEIEEAKRLKQTSVLDVVIDAAGEVLKEFIGINDIKGCFGGGSIGSCLSLAMNLPWTKIFRIGDFIGAVKKAWNAVTNFLSRKKNAEKLLDKVDDLAKKADDTPAGGKQDKRQLTEAETTEGVEKPSETRANAASAGARAAGRAKASEKTTTSTSTEVGHTPGPVAGGAGSMAPDLVGTLLIGVAAVGTGVTVMAKRIFRRDK